MSVNLGKPPIRTATDDLLAAVDSVEQVTTLIRQVACTTWLPDSERRAILQTLWVSLDRESANACARIDAVIES